MTKQSPSFGDEENIEPMVNRNNNNSNNNNNNLLYQPIALQTSGELPSIKREVHLLEENEDNAGVVLASSSPYTGEILIENPETGRFVPLKLEDQLVYVTAATSAEGLPTTTYYRHDLGDNSSASATEFMDVVSWWEQEQGRLHQTHQLGQQRLAHV